MNLIASIKKSLSPAAPAVTTTSGMTAAIPVATPVVAQPALAAPALVAPEAPKLPFGGKKHPGFSDPAVRAKAAATQAANKAARDAVKGAEKEQRAATRKAERTAGWAEQRLAKRMAKYGNALFARFNYLTAIPGGQLTALGDTPANGAAFLGALTLAMPGVRVIPGGPDMWTIVLKHRDTETAIVLTYGGGSLRFSAVGACTQPVVDDLAHVVALV